MTHARQSTISSYRALLTERGLRFSSITSMMDCAIGCLLGCLTIDLSGSLTEEPTGPALLRMADNPPPWGRGQRVVGVLRDGSDGRLVLDLVGSSTSATADDTGSDRAGQARLAELLGSERVSVRDPVGQHRTNERQRARHDGCVLGLGAGLRSTGS